MSGSFHRDSDPIETSSPVAKGYHSAKDDSDGDSLFDDVQETIATVPYDPTQPMSQRVSQMVPSSSPPPGSYTTQPTQLITPRKTTHDPNRVPETSPAQMSSALGDRLSPKIPERLKPSITRTIGSLMAPPGTQFRPPPTLPSASQTLAGDPPFEQDSEDELALRDSDIKPQKWSFGSQQDRTRVSSFGGKLSSFSYEAPKKRQIDDMLGAYSNSSRPPKHPKQTGPSRAKPADVPDMTIDEIKDYHIRQNVNRIRIVFPHASVRMCTDALFKTRGNLQDAQGIVAEQLLLQEVEAEDRMKESAGKQSDVIEISDDDAKAQRKGVARTTQPMIRKQPTMKQGPITTKTNIHDRWRTGQRQLLSPQQRQPSQLQDEQAPKRRKLVQGRRTRSSSPQESIEVESDGESAARSSSPEQDLGTDEDLLNIFNTYPIEGIMDLCLQPEETVQLVIDKRPFRSLAAIRKLTVDQPEGKKGRSKAIGEKIVDAAEEMHASFMAVDSLVDQCSQMGAPLASEMKKWGVDVYGSRSQGEGELELVNFDDVSDGGSSAKDSGIGTPTGTPAPRPQSQSQRRKIDFLKKPSIMSEDLELKDYQLVGLNWLALLWKQGLSGLLADEMGLGKTCQVITFLSHLKEKNVQGPHLIIVTSSTVENWLQEFDRFSPSLDVRAYHGSQADRVNQRYEILEQRHGIDVIITTYDMVRSEDDARFLRKKLKPVVVVCDEAHALKNSSSQRYAQLMRVPATMRILLTGTPVQNNLIELVSLLGFLMPDIFDDFTEDLSYLFKYKVKTSDKDHSALLSARRIQRARTMMAPFILRRKKIQVLKHLPPKTTRVEYCELSESQRELYDRLMSTYEVGDSKKKTASSMMKLRQAAIHPLMMREHYDDEIWDISLALCDGQEGRKQQNKYHQLFDFSDGSLNKLCREYDNLRKHALDDELLYDSGKVVKLLEILKSHIADGHRTLLFSQFTSALDILEGVFEQEQIRFTRLDGSTKVSDRQALIDAFNADAEIPVFMLSTKAGGVGINLASANRVIIFDSSFNPQEDQQAMDRAHRVGQTRPVEVVSLVSKDTIEEDIYALGASKLALDTKLAGGEVANDDSAGVEMENAVMVEQRLKEKVEQRKLEQSAKKNKGKDAKDVFAKSMKKKGFDTT